MTKEIDEQGIIKIVEQELTRRGWKLAAEPSLFAPTESFIGRVLRRVPLWCAEKGRPLDEEIVRQATVHEYCHLLHRAVSWNGSRVQTIALQETIDYGWPVALKHCTQREMAESAILRAANKTWQNIDRCNPGSYLAFFCTTLRREIGQELRGQMRRDREISEVDLSPPDQEDDRDAGALDYFEAVGWQGSTAFSQIDLKLSRRSFFHKLRRCLQNARREFVIQAQFWGEMSISKIAQTLQLTAQQVTQAKFHALRRIRNDCPEVKQELILLLTP